MEEYKRKLYVKILAGCVGFGFGLLLVSMFLDVLNVKADILGMSAGINMFSEEWDGMDSSPTMLTVAFAIALAGIATMAVAVGKASKTKKDMTKVLLAGVIISACGTLLILVAGLLLRGNVEDEMMKIALAAAKASGGDGTPEATLIATIKAMLKINFGIGVIMGLIGALVSTIGGALLLHKPFNPHTI